MTYEVILTKKIDDRINIAFPMDIYRFIKKNIGFNNKRIILLTLNRLDSLISSYIIHVGELLTNFIDEHKIYANTLKDKSHRIIICYIQDDEILEPSPKIYKAASSIYKTASILKIS
jgi:DNA repair protein RadC